MTTTFSSKFPNIYLNNLLPLISDITIETNNGKVLFTELTNAAIEYINVDDTANWISTIYRGNGSNLTSYKNIALGVKNVSGEIRPIISAIDPTLSIPKPLWLNNDNSSVIIGDISEASIATNLLAVNGGILSNSQTIRNSSNHVKWEFTTNNIQFTASEPSANRLYTIPDAGANALFIMSAGNSSISGQTTFTRSSNPLVFNPSATFTTTITATTPSANRVYTIPDVGADASFFMVGGNQTLDGAFNFSQQLTLSATSNQLRLLPGANSITLTASSPSANRIYTVPDVGGNSSFALLAGTQTFTGAKSFSTAITSTTASNQLIFDPASTFTTTLTVLTPSANRIYTLSDVGSDSSFALLAGTQTFDGIKSFSAQVTLSATSNQLRFLPGANSITLSTSSPSANRIYTIPDVGTNSSFVMTAGAQILGGAKTFASTITSIASSNQFIFDPTSTFTTTLTVLTPSANRIYTIPDVGSDSTFMMLDGTQTITGIKTFTQPMVFAETITSTASSNQLVFDPSSTFTTTITSLTPSANRIYTIPDIGSDSSFAMLGGSQTFDGIKTFTQTTTFSAQTTLSATSNQLRFLPGANSITLTASSPSANRIYTIPDVGSNCSFAMLAGIQTFSGAKTFSTTITSTASSNQLIFDPSASNTTTITISTPSADRIYTIPDIGSDSSFAMLGGSQTFDGIKTFTQSTTFSAQTTLSATSNQLRFLPGANSITLTASSPSANRIYTLPDVGGNSSFALLAGTQTFTGAKTFSTTITSTAPSSQLLFDTSGSFTTTINVQEPSSNRVYSIPDVGTNSLFAMLAAIQTFSNTNTFTAQTTFAHSILSTASSNQIILTPGANSITLTASSPIANRIYTIPDAGTNTSFALLAGTQTFSGAKTFSASIISTVATNQLIFDPASTFTTTLTVSAPTADRIYTIPDIGINSIFAMLNGTQTFNGTKTFSTAITSTTASNQLVFDPSAGFTTTLTIPTPSANRIYTVSDIGTNSSFAMLAGTQTFNGAKTFSTAITSTTASNQLIFDTASTFTTTLTIPTPSANRIYTISDVNTNTSFAMLGGPQTFNGTKTFSATIISTTASNQIVFNPSSTFTTTLTIPTPSANRIYTIPDIGVDSAFSLLAGTQTFDGTKTFSAQMTLSATSNQLRFLPGANSFTITASNPAASRIFTLPDVADANFVMSQGIQTINGSKTFNANTLITNGTLSINNGSGSTAGVITASALTNNRTYTFPDKSGTLGLDGRAIVSMFSNLTTGSATYTELATMPFAGSTLTPVLTACYITFSNNSGGVGITFNFRIQDTTNSVTIAESTTLIGGATNEVVLRTIPILATPNANPAMWSFQLRAPTTGIGRLGGIIVI